LERMPNAGANSFMPFGYLCPKEVFALMVLQCE
jgi:hypothetical protein